MNPTYQTYYQSPVGLLKISATEHVIIQVLFVDKTEEIKTTGELSPLLQQCIEQLIEYFNGVRQVFDLPVYQEGTPFQNTVWSELLNIKFGRTITYLDLAKRLGDPKVIRAAASTNGKNNICIIIPCHRVVGTNNSLVGYSGGLPRKKWLLNHENKIVNGVQTLF
ncbi:MAG: methylated-DNA--[protein]-cysteine S-methyltransferase [Chitinophagaceae bacterium]|nr:methylated-DNA--[protein]-cysteine S-methyltransferase [Chitinophagaceae bacterium]